MLHKYLIVVVLVITLLSSCIVGTKVAIHNESTKDKNIQVYYPSGLPFPFSIKEDGKDSLPGYDHTLTQNAFTTRDWYRYPVKVPLRSLDTAARTYYFTLKAGYEIVLEEGYPSFDPLFGQLFIIDQIDTIVLDKKRTFFKKRPKLGKGGSWLYTIADTK